MIARLITTALLAASSILLTMVICRAQNLPMSDFAGSGQRVVKITTQPPTWALDNVGGTAALIVKFEAKNADGSAIKFAAPMAASSSFRVGGWTENDFDCSLPHEGSVTPDPDGKGWIATIPGINPHSRIAHVEVDVRDPNASSSQSTDSFSNLQIDDVPFPAVDDQTQPFTHKFTTPWGAELTFNGLTVVTKSFFTKTVLRYDFGINFAKVPDDNLNFQAINMYDGGVPVDGFKSDIIGTTTTNGYYAPYTEAIPSGSHKSVRIEFQIHEFAISPSLTVGWTPIEFDVPVPAVPTIQAKPPAEHVTTAKIGSCQFSFEDLDFPMNWMHSYRMWTNSLDPNSKFRLFDAGWLGKAAPHDQNATSENYDLYWHTNGNPFRSGEYGLHFDSHRSETFYPIGVTSQRVIHKQQVLIFRAVPVPQPGQKILLNRMPESSSSYPLSLRSIKWVDQNGDADTSMVAYKLELTFVLAAPLGSAPSIEMLSARDSENNALGAFIKGTAPSTTSPIASDSLFNLQISIPPHGSKFVRFKAIVTEEMPAGPPVHLSMDSDGKWNVLPQT